MEYRRFGKTELRMPVISCGGMRYQQSWKRPDPISEESQRLVESCIRRAFDLGINHIETAYGYGTSEEQLGHILPKLPRNELIVQTKVAPFDSVDKFQATFDDSMAKLQLEHVDLFAFHGINNHELLELTKRCMDRALQWKREGRIRHIGFSTHAHVSTIVDAIETDWFDYVNLHWYYIFQDNWPAIEAARKRDMGVFIISPNDKGGKLYSPPEKLRQLTHPLEPMVFNGLFCLMHDEVHTLSCGAARPDDFDVHMEMAAKLPQARELVPPILERLEAEMGRTLGEDWARTWQQGLPEWNEAPSEVNLPVILRMWNLAKAFDMVEYGRMRYNMLGNASHWFPGQKASKLHDGALRDALKRSPHADRIPAILQKRTPCLKGRKASGCRNNRLSPLCRRCQDRQPGGHRHGPAGLRLEPKHGAA